MKIVLVAGARPNFMKIAPIYAAMQKFTELEPYILHTGQHYDHALSESFFEDLALPPPSFHLGVGSGTAGEQIGRIIIACEQTFYEQSPDLVIVVGDVNSTLPAPSSHRNSQLHLPTSKPVCDLSIAPCRKK